MVALDTHNETREAIYSAVDVLRDKYGGRAQNLGEPNEAETRLLLVDSVLKGLGWRTTDFNPEHRAGTQGYIDYLLKADSVPYLVVEAKRIGSTFGPPRQQSRKDHYQLRYLRSAYGRPFTEVFNQAQRYARLQEVPYAIITNGAEWVLVQVVLSPGFNNLDDLKGVYFGSLLRDDFRFELFWEILYRPHVEQGSLDEYFGLLHGLEAEYSRTPQSEFGELCWKKATGEEFLHFFYQLFFDEITDVGRRKMLEKCFVSNSHLDHYQGELQRALRDVAPAFMESAIEITPDERERLLAADSGDRKGRVILVTGAVGCGKSTLVTKVLVETHQADKQMAHKWVALVVDLINEETSESTDVDSLLWQRIMRQWEEKEPESTRFC